jgi:hypothetical protein
MSDLDSKTIEGIGTRARRLAASFTWVEIQYQNYPDRNKRSFKTDATFQCFMHDIIKHRYFYLRSLESIQ